MSQNAKTESARPALLKIPAAARELGISQSALYVLLKAGEIGSILVGPKSRRIPWTEIEAYIARKLADPDESLKAAS